MTWWLLLTIDQYGCFLYWRTCNPQEAKISFRGVHMLNNIIGHSLTVDYPTRLTTRVFPEAGGMASTINIHSLCSQNFWDLTKYEHSHGTYFINITLLRLVYNFMFLNSHFVYTRIFRFRKVILKMVQGSPKESFPGLENFVTAVAYHLCLNLPATFSQPGNDSFGDPCTLCNMNCSADGLNVFCAFQTCFYTPKLPPLSVCEGITQRTFDSRAKGLA